MVHTCQISCFNQNERFSLSTDWLFNPSYFPKNVLYISNQKYVVSIEILIILNSRRILLTSLRFFSCSPFTLRGAHVVLFYSIMTFSLIECFQFVLSKIFIAKATKMLRKREKVTSFNIVKSTLPVFAIFIQYILVCVWVQYVCILDIWTEITSTFDRPFR